jgi:membrane associated rhomboid family serine protease
MYNKSRMPLLGDNKNALTWLIIINASVFILLNFLKIVYFLSDIPEAFFNRQILQWFTLPASVESLSTKPWVIFTYMFTHLGVFPLISSLLWLWSFGYILQDLTGNNKLFPLYLYGGFIGCILFVLTNNIFPVLANNIANIAPLMGAGAAVMAIAVATTTLAPDYRIFPLINGGIPLWVLTLIFVAIDYATIASQNAGTAIAHLGGGAFGFFYIKQLQKGKDWGNWMIVFWNWLDNLFNPEKQLATQKNSNTLYYKKTAEPFNKIPNLTQKKLDDILDKINNEGYHMLTDEEKQFLKRASKEEL